MSVRTRFLGGAISLGVIAAATVAFAQDTTADAAAMRAQATALSANGDCRSAISLFERAGRADQRASDFLSAGNCAIETGEPRRASLAFAQALALSPQLSPQEHLYAARALGFQAAAGNDDASALEGWRQAYTLSQGASDALQAARAARVIGRSGEAQSFLAAVDTGELTPSEQAAYFEERGRALAETQPSQAADYFARAIALEDRGYRRFEQALLLDRAGRREEALTALEAARRAEPGNVDILLSEAYLLRRLGRNDEAAARFESALTLAPDRFEVQEDYAYALKAAGREADSRAAFMQVVDNEARYPQNTEAERAVLSDRLYRVRREIEQLERRGYGFAFLSYRDNFTNTGFNLPEQGVPVSQLGGEVGWRPDALYSDGRGVTLYGRGFVSLGEDSLDPNGDSLQFGVGARWKPFSQHDFSVGAERLIAGGDLARDAWLLRASYGWSDGLDWNPTARSWNYTSVYADLAYIVDSPEYLSAYAALRQGRRFRAGEGVAITPYITAVAQYSDDSFATRDRFEVGPGIAASWWLGDDRYTAYRQRLDLELEYRFATGEADDAVLARVVWNF